MRQWLNQASDLNTIAKTAASSAIKEALVKIEGLNLFLKSKKAQPTASPAIAPPFGIWVWLRQTLEKTGATRLKSLENPFLVPRAGFEPATLGLEVLCSIQLSYRGAQLIVQKCC